MNDAYGQVAGWFADPANWYGPAGLVERTGVYLWQCFATLALAALVAVPLGLFIGHTGYGRSVMVPVTGALRSLPTLGLLSALSLLLGLGLAAPMAALTVLAVPPILAGVYAGIESVEGELVDASRAIGFTEWEILVQVELPLAAPLIVAGFRSATVQVLATWTVAAYLPVEGLGRYLIDGLAVHDYVRMLAGSVVVIVLELAANGLFAVLGRVVAGRLPTAKNQ
ncbi:ABC transporter permease [Bifidobacterium catulorum]|uniref:Glycine/betaine ABC transporter permease n=1 Tax=Bifidobacterium catulorum TaxID=1630173 RepID=A0A2U2MSR9_9BIFI|nr:ABC transporter permease subunit [Bifidobacterium catulorum]PWG59898.1 glycine/betaine ABC transporter permease [Bifidobacterium catulorum]